MTPSHYPDDDGTVNVIGADRVPEFTEYAQRTQRSEAQRHTDTALDTAEEAAAEAADQTEATLEWLDSIGAVTPAKLRNLPTLLGQLQRFIEDERARRP